MGNKKSGRARKTTSRSNDKKSVTFYLKAELKTNFKKYCEIKNISMSASMESLLEKFLEEMGVLSTAVAFIKSFEKEDKPE